MKTMKSNVCGKFALSGGWKYTTSLRPNYLSLPSKEVHPHPLAAAIESCDDWRHFTKGNFLNFRRNTISCSLADWGMQSKSFLLMLMIGSCFCLSSLPTSKDLLQKFNTFDLLLARSRMFDRMTDGVEIAFSAKSLMEQ